MTWEIALGVLGLYALAGALLLLEFIVISWGMLTVVSAVVAAAGVALAWHAGASWGIAALVALPVLAALVIRTGLRTLKAGGAVPTATIAGDAGYRHAAVVAGVSVGQRGELVTDAVPTGRARFAHGEVDVAVAGAALPRGTPIEVLRIDGPVVTVAAVAATPRA